MPIQIIKRKYFSHQPHHPQVEITIFECNWCHNEFERKSSFYRKQLKRSSRACCFCSRSCKSKWIASRNFLKGDNNSKWKGGKRINNNGYIDIYCPNHPHAIRGKYVSEHRLVMEKFLGRFLNADEIVHHIDENKQNNSIDNLQLFTQSEHSRHHNFINIYRGSFAGKKHTKETRLKMRLAKLGKKRGPHKSLVHSM